MPSVMCLVSGQSYHGGLCACWTPAGWCVLTQDSTNHKTQKSHTVSWAGWETIINTCLPKDPTLLSASFLALTSSSACCSDLGRAIALTFAAQSARLILVGSQLTTADHSCGFCAWLLLLLCMAAVAFVTAMTLWLLCVGCREAVGCCRCPVSTCEVALLPCFTGPAH